jgi:ABC-type amino acid transport substrate-binding protein
VETYSLMMRRDADFRLAVNRALAGIYRSGDIALVFRQAFGPGFLPSSVLEAAYLLNALPE